MDGRVRISHRSKSVVRLGVRGGMEADQQEEKVC